MPQSTREILGEVSLFDVALDLHMSTTGSGDPWATDPARCVAILEMAVRDWEEGPTYCKAFDDAVKNLLVVALQEYRAYNLTLGAQSNEKANGVQI